MPYGRPLLNALRPILATSPAVLPAAAAVATVIALAATNGGYSPTTWYPGALFVLGLLTVAALGLPGGAMPRSVLVAVGALAVFAGWSYLSMAWANQPAYAWEGGNRALFYALVLALFSLWRLRAAAAAVLLGGLALGIAGVGLVELFRAAGSSHTASFFVEGRLASPAGYQNANAALWMIGLFPCVALAARKGAHPAWRGAFVAAGVVLAALALMAQSRGWLFATPPALALFLLISRERVRTALALLLVVLGTAACAAPVLHVYTSHTAGELSRAVDSAALAVPLAALGTGAVAAGLGVLERRRPLGALAVRRVGAGLAVAAALAACAGLTVWIAADGNPVTTVSHAWRDFKTKPTPTGGASRFTASLGSHRYDFWRVAVDRFAAHPLAGIGSANFQQDYLARGKSYEQPRFPHSLELGVLSQTGLVGAALLVVALGSAIAAGVAAVWRRSGIGSAVAAGALGSFVYWVIHGSIDWFWEFPGVAAAAFALLGLAAGLEPRRPAPAGNPGAASPLVDSPRLAVPLAAGVLVALASFGAPWMSELYSDQAADSWARSPATAFYKLDRAASLDPLSARPKLLAGSIALRLQSWNQAERYFNQALDRDPRDAYAHLELGALASQQGRRAQAEALLGQAVKLSPRDAISAFALGRVRDGRTVTTTQINNQLLARTQRLLK